MLRGPGIAPCGLREDLVEHIDIAALSLAAAHIPLPGIMQGRDILAPDYRARNAVFAARDRCGEAADRIRSVRTDRYLYIRNFFPLRPHLQPNNYKDSKAIIQRLRKMHTAGELPPLTERLLFAETRPPEELYLYREDRWQATNLANHPAHADAMENHRALLDQWTRETSDPGPESSDIYDLEIQDELRTIKPGTIRHREFSENAVRIKRWVAEGK